MTPDPAYETANVLAVRTAPAVGDARPNLEQVRAWLLTERYDALSR